MATDLNDAQQLCPHPPHMVMPTQNNLGTCGVCGADNVAVVQTGNASHEGPTDPQERREWVIDQINSIGQKFSNYGFNLNQLYADKPMIMALQGNALSMLLIKKGIITKDEMDEMFFDLMLEKFREHERLILPQLREASIKATTMPAPPQNGMPDEIKRLLGPDGNTLL